MRDEQQGVHGKAEPSPWVKDPLDRYYGYGSITPRQQLWIIMGIIAFTVVGTILWFILPH